MVRSKSHVAGIVSPLKKNLTVCEQVPLEAPLQAMLKDVTGFLFDSAQCYTQHPGLKKAQDAFTAAILG